MSETIRCGSNLMDIRGRGGMVGSDFGTTGMGGDMDMERVAMSEPFNEVRVKRASTPCLTASR